MFLHWREEDQETTVCDFYVLGHRFVSHAMLDPYMHTHARTHARTHIHIRSSCLVSCGKNHAIVATQNNRRKSKTSSDGSLETGAGNALSGTRSCTKLCVRACVAAFLLTYASMCPCLTHGALYAERERNVASAQTSPPVPSQKPFIWDFQVHKDTQFVDALHLVNVSICGCECNCTKGMWVKERRRGHKAWKSNGAN